jgi:hypothetical protein
VPDGKFFIPVKSTINLKTGNSETETLEVTEEQYLDFLRPFAEIVAENFVNELVKIRA